MTREEPAAPDKVFTVTISFDQGTKEFDYSLAYTGGGPAKPGRRQKVQKGNNNKLEWNCVDYPFAIRFDSAFPPLPEWEYRNKKNNPAGDRIVEARGRYKYWVAVLYDGMIYMDDPDVVVEA